MKVPHLLYARRCATRRSNTVGAPKRSVFWTAILDIAMDCTAATMRLTYTLVGDEMKAEYFEVRLKMDKYLSDRSYTTNGSL